MCIVFQRFQYLQGVRLIPRGRWVIGLLGYWVIRLLGYWIIGEAGGQEGWKKEHLRRQGTGGQGQKASSNHH